MFLLKVWDQGVGSFSVEHAVLVCKYLQWWAWQFSSTANKIFHGRNSVVRCCVRLCDSVQGLKSSSFSQISVRKVHSQPLELAFWLLTLWLPELLQIFQRKPPNSQKNEKKNSNKGLKYIQIYILLKDIERRIKLLYVYCCQEEITI